MTSPYLSVILLAGGIGSRMRSDIPKQYLPLDNQAIVLHSYFLFAKLTCVREIVVVCEPSYQDVFPLFTHPKIHFSQPGTRRQDSVWNGLTAASPDCEWVCIHDSARPLLREKDCLNLIEQAKIHGAAVLATPVQNTIKTATPTGLVSQTLDRSTLWNIQTPQMIRTSLLHEGYAAARAQNNRTVTDDVSLVELLGHPVKLVEGHDSNIKITTPADLALAETLLSQYAKI